MALTSCPECNYSPVSTRAAACPKCGCLIADPGKPQESQTIIDQVDERNSVAMDSLEHNVNQFDCAFLHNGVLRLDCDEITKVETRDLVDMCAPVVTKVKLTGLNIPLAVEILEQLQRFSTLQDLDMQLFSRLTDEVLLYIADLSSLQTLELGAVLRSNRITIDGLSQLGRLTHLRLLRVRSIMMWSMQLGMKQNEFTAFFKQTLPRTILVDSDPDDDDEDEDE